MTAARYTVTIDGEDYIIVPDTFVEGAVRRQAEFAYLGEEDLKSRPDTREWLHNSWIGGAQWEKPLYGRTNQDTYFESGDLSFTDRAGAVQESAELQPLDSDLGFALYGNVSKFAAFNSSAWVGGAVTLYKTSSTVWQWADWNEVTDVFDDRASRTSTLTANTVYVMAMATSPAGLVYALFSDGVVAFYDPVANTNSLFSTSLTVYNGATIWVDKDYVWLYDGDKLRRILIDSGAYTPTEIMADDDDGYDAYGQGLKGILSTPNPIIGRHESTRCINTSEGIFYVKNVLDKGLYVAKIYRVDRDASGSFILTPIGTLPKGEVAINITHHLGSILISTVPNFLRAIDNVDDQKVTIYHVTGRSIGAVGSVLGGTNVDETPVWFLGTHNEMLYIGGRKRIWMYDGRVGSFHAVHVESDNKYLNFGGGFNDMITVACSDGYGVLFKHSSNDGTSAAPYFELLIEDSLITTSDDTAFITSNWFDFDLPMEEKTIYEVFYDVSDVRTDSTILIQVSADGGAFTTVLTITGGTSSNTIRTALSTPITGYKFQYKLVWSTDTNTSSPEPSRLYSVGFAAFGGEMVDILQFTIDGNESMNIENLVQSPSDVYTALETLRNTKEEITVTHSFNMYDGATLVTGTYRVSSVTGRHSDAHSGEYEIQLIEVPA